MAGSQDVAFAEDEIQTVPKTANELRPRTPEKTEGYVNEVLSSPMWVPPLRDDQVAVYKLIEADKKDPTHVDDRSGAPQNQKPGYQLVGRKRIYDRFAKRTVIIWNRITEKKTSSSLGEITTKRAAPVRFLSDKLVYVQPSEPETYAFLERCDENKDNPFRNSKVKAKYYRVDHKKKMKNEMENNYFQFEAQEWVMRKASFKDLCAAGVKINEYLNENKIRTEFNNEDAAFGNDLIKRELYALAAKDPELVIRASTDKASKLKLQIHDAEKFMVVFFDDRTKSWYLNENPVPPVIYTVQVGENKYDSLMKHFETEKGKADYKKMSENLKTLLSLNKGR